MTYGGPQDLVLKTNHMIGTLGYPKSLQEKGAGVCAYQAVNDLINHAHIIEPQ